VDSLPQEYKLSIGVLWLDQLGSAHEPELVKHQLTMVIIAFSETVGFFRSGGVMVLIYNG
jgi:hypothetical protein